MTLPFQIYSHEYNNFIMFFHYNPYSMTLFLQLYDLIKNSLKLKAFLQLTCVSPNFNIVLDRIQEFWEPKLEGLER